MSYNPGQAPGGAPYPTHAGGQYPLQPAPQYPGQPAPQYPLQPAPQYPGQPAPQYPGQPAPQYPQAPGQYPPHSGGHLAPQGGQYPAQGGQYPPQTGGQYPPQTGGQYTPQTGGQHPLPPRRQAEAYQTDAAPLGPSAPPQIEGYRNIGFDGGFVRPPAQSLPSAPPPDQPSMNIAQDPLTRGEVKDALAAYVAQHCCYGSGPIKDIQIRNVAPTATFKYTLDTFIEKRETKWKFEPCKADNISTGAGTPPGPWDIPLTPKALFKKEKRVMQVPNTQSLRPCHDCQAHGDTRCKHCAGRGHDRCGQCGGSGERLGDQCSRCAGTGTTTCTWCNGHGMITCNTCKGSRNLMYFVELTVTWEVHSDKYVVETPGLPDSEVTEVSGETVCQAQGIFVWPFAGFPEERIARASGHLVKKHQTGWPMARVLQQRHDVQQVPIHSVAYNYQGEDGTFFVCGRERNVFYPDYPSQCCGCCCTLL